MATTYFDPSFQAYALQARTDSVGAAVDDVTGEDMRLILQLYTEGIVGVDSYVVAENSAGASMNVEVGSGNVDTDKAIIAGDASGQGNYLARMVDANDLLTVPAADLSNPRIDEVYLVVQDSGYDSSANVVPRLAYRDGTPASSPSAPGPDADWEAYLLLATVAVAAGETAIETAHITDERTGATLLPSLNGEVADSAFVADGGALTGSMVSIASVTLSIPSGWSTWECEAYTFFFVSGASSAAVQSVITIDGTDGDTQDWSVPAAVGSWPGRVGDHRPGISTTGDRTIAFRSRVTAGSVTNLLDVYLYARAVRTS